MAVLPTSNNSTTSPVLLARLVLVLLQQAGDGDEAMKLKAVRRALQEAVPQEQDLQRLLRAGAAAGVLQLVQQGGKERVQLRHSALKAYAQGGEEAVVAGAGSSAAGAAAAQGKDPTELLAAAYAVWWLARKKNGRTKSGSKLHGRLQRQSGLSKRRFRALLGLLCEAGVLRRFREDGLELVQ